VTEQRPDEAAERQDGVRVTDKRRIDPDTFEVRQATEPGAPETDEAAIVEEDIDEVQSKVAELTSDLQRVHAEYANYRKRVDRDRELIRVLAVGAVLTDLLPVLDDVNRAREHGELEGAFRSVGEALEASLAKIGLERFGGSGEPFDPAVHEALTSEAREDIAEPTVISVYQPGYRYAGRVLRPARVAVAGTD
jgi:molecular chaperone GrpE